LTIDQLDPAHKALRLKRKVKPRHKPILEPDSGIVSLPSHATSRKVGSQHRLPWLNAVETFFATLTKRGLKRGVFRSVVDLQAAINRYLAQANHDPKPFVWTANPDKIIAAVNRGRQALDSIH
jgi:hypothetical protein